jgi:putative SOS response-associated peptidase YedK
VESCTIIITAANEFVQLLHHRMPVNLQGGDYAKWLDTTTQETDKLMPLLDPRDWTNLESYQRQGSEK